MAWYAVGAVLLPILSVPLNIWAFKKSERLRNIALFGITGLTFIMVQNLLSGVKAGQDLSVHVFSMLDVWEIVLKVDPFGQLFAMLSAGLWIFTALYSIGYMEGEKSQIRFFLFLTICLGVTMGIAFAGNLFTLYLFYEILTFVSYPLVVHYQTGEALKAGKKYLIYSLAGAGSILLAMIIVYSLTERLDFARGGLFQGPELLTSSRWLLELTLALFVFGFGVKGALMPLHSWLPSAMVAPTPVSALFHAVAVVNSGMFGIIRVLYGIFGSQVLRQLWMGKVFLGLVFITILVGSAVALLQDNLKRRLAYSTISQLGYITLGAFLVSSDGLRGGILHIVNHGLLKIVLFFCAGTIYKVTHKKKISEIRGIGRKMPLTMGAFSLAAFGIIGIPPTNGFISKWYLLQGGVEARSVAAIVVLLGSALLSAGYFLPIVVNAFFYPEQEELPVYAEGREAPLVMLIPILCITMLALLFGVAPHIPLSLVDQGVEMMGMLP